MSLDQYYGFNPPFFGGPQKILSKQVGERLIKNDILQFLLTNRGERVHRPNYGTSIGTTVFESITPNLLDTLRIEIIEGLRQEEPRIIVNDVVVRAATKSKKIEVTIIGVLRSDPNIVFNMEANIGA